MSDFFGALVELGGDLIKENYAEEAREDARVFAREQQTENARLQKEFAQMGLRWKVADAQAAGVHPLLAMGASGAAFAPNPVVMQDTSDAGSSFQKMGQNLSRAIAAQETADQRQDRELQRGLVLAQTRKADEEANYAHARALEIASPGQVGPAMPSGAGNAVISPAQALSMPPAVMFKPSEMESFDPRSGHVSAPQGAHQEFHLGDGHRISLPSQALAEAWEDMPLLGQAYYGLKNWRLPGEMVSQRFSDWLEEHRHNYRQKTEARELFRRYTGQYPRTGDVVNVPERGFRNYEYRR